MIFRRCSTRERQRDSDGERKAPRVRRAEQFGACHDERVFFEPADARPAKRPPHRDRLTSLIVMERVAFGWRWEEIGKIHGRKPDAVRMIFNRAPNGLKQLAERLYRGGDSPDDDFRPTAGHVLFGCQPWVPEKDQSVSGPKDTCICGAGRKSWQSQGPKYYCEGCGRTGKDTHSPSVREFDDDVS